MTEKKNDPLRESGDTNSVPKFSRRHMLQTAVGVSAIVGTAGTANAKATAFSSPDNGHPILAENRNSRSTNVMSMRTDAAHDWTLNFEGQQETNGDEGLYSDYRASFSKALPHNDLGEVDKAAFLELRSALKSRNSSAFENIPLGGTRRLVNPQGSLRYEMVGRDGHSTYMRPAPVFAGAETAAEMGELYWKVICRDVPFASFEWDPLVAAATRDLNAFSSTVGPKDGGIVTVDTVFRGETAGDLVGPYISQFLLQDIPYGNGTIVQRYPTPAPEADFMTNEAEWLGIQRGVDPAPLSKGSPRYISDARALGEFVHLDFSFQAYQGAALILLSIPDSLDTHNLYNSSTTQEGFVTFGGPDVLHLVAQAGNLALTAAWYQKWLVHRRARPEVYAGRLHHQLKGNKDYGLPDEIADCEGLAKVKWFTGSYFLPMAFPEGSPTHPAYPAGHACMAGACCTVLKALFNESMPIPNPVTPDYYGTTLNGYLGTLTIGGEINKLANNISLGRDWAGVHYRSDGVDGLKVGEQIAIGLLKDYSRTYNEDFAGFQLTKFDGTSITIKDGQVI